MNGIFGVISAKFCTFVIAMIFLIPPNSAFHGLLEEFLFPSVGIQNFHHINNQFFIKISTFYDSAYSNLVEEIDKQEEVKEQKANLDNELQLLKQAISNLHDSIQKVEKVRKDGTDMVIAMKAATDSMDMAVFAFCRAVTRAEATVLKVEMTDECQNAIKSAREKLIQAETDLLASHRRLQLQEFRNQNEEITSFIKSCQGVFLSPNVFWWWAGISYATSLYSLWCILQMALQWLKY